MSKKDYSVVYKHYESCYEKHGNKPEGFDWPNWDDLNTRFKVLTGLIPDKGNYSILDFGCGSGFMIDFLKENGLINRVKYKGVDISQKFITIAKQNHPTFDFECIDILKEDGKLENFDIAILNGVFTMRAGMEEEDMWDFMQTVLKKLFSSVNIGITFNVMSKIVDWEREDLFHLSMDKLGQFLSKNLSRHFVIRNDYGLYEYSVYVSKTPNK